MKKEDKEVNSASKSGKYVEDESELSDKCSTLDDWEEEFEEKKAPKKKPAVKKSSVSEAESKNTQKYSADKDSKDKLQEISSSESKESPKKKKNPATASQESSKVQVSAKASSDANENGDTENLRSPICCILGHVDTGKTKLLDKIRQTNVQEGEAGGITQQIGATFFPIEAIRAKTKVIQKTPFDFKLPGLLIIDTPGHESFTNLRSRGSSLCNIAILVIDIMHGLEQQTIESINLLKQRKTPFIVALNKIDRIYGWKPIPNGGFQQSFAKQNQSTKNEFKDRLGRIQLSLSEQGLNSALYYENKNVKRFVSIVPTSAFSGEGIPDLLMLIVNLTQQRLSDKLMYLSELECTVLEVKVIEGFGTTIDVILSNGILREGDRIVLSGLNGAIATNIRALLTPEPMKEMRVKGAYVHHRMVKAALGVKISAPDLEKAIAGSRLLVVGPDDDEEDIKELVEEDVKGLLDMSDKSGRGVFVQASTLGSLEALLEFLKNPDPKNNMPAIPVAGIGIGPVYKKDVMRAATMLEKNPDMAILMCFDVKIDKEADALARELGVKIFSANIIYHLFDSFVAHQKELLDTKRERLADTIVYPCILKTVAVFNARNPILLGVDVTEGSLRVNTPICAVKEDPVTKQRQVVSLGRVTGIEQNHKVVQIAKKGGPSVAVKIEANNQILFGRQVEETDTLYSQISRASIDVFKEQPWREEISKDGPMKNLLVHLKKVCLYICTYANFLLN